MGRLDGQVAWVTGAASGIGKAIAATFAAEGAEVAALDIDAELGERVVKGINDNGGKAIFIKCDVAREAEVQDALERTAATFDGLDILANNAGIVQVGPLDQCTEEAWDRLMGSTSSRPSSRSSTPCRTCGRTTAATSSMSGQSAVS